VNHARRDLCGGCAAMRIPTAIAVLAQTCRQFKVHRNSFLQCVTPRNTELFVSCIYVKAHHAVHASAHQRSLQSEMA
jgi:hypothetical protein